MTAPPDDPGAQLSARLHAELDGAPVPRALLTAPAVPAGPAARRPRRWWVPAVAVAAAIVLITTVAVVVAQRRPPAGDVAAPSPGSSSGAAVPSEDGEPIWQAGWVCGALLSMSRPRGGLTLLTASRRQGERTYLDITAVPGTALRHVAVESEVVVTDSAGRVLGITSSRSPIGLRPVDLAAGTPVRLEPVIVDSYSSCAGSPDPRVPTTSTDQLWVIAWVVRVDDAGTAPAPAEVLLDGVVRVDR